MNILAQFNKLSLNQKIVLIVVLIIVAWILKNKIKGYLAAQGSNIQTKSEISVLQANGIKATYPEEKYQKLADYLFTSMNRMWPDANAVYNAFSQLRNDIDFIKVSREFGIREADDNWFGLVPAKNLAGWITSYLKGPEIQNINSILKDRGISKRF